MESYLMMLYVTLEQESALKNFFVDQGWTFCKPDLSVTTDKVGPSVTTPVVPLKDKAAADDTVADQNKQSSRFVVKEPESIPKTDSPLTRNKGKRKTESPLATATNVKQPKVLLPLSTVTVPKSSESVSSKTEVVDKPLSSSSNLTPITVLGEDGKHFTIKIEQDADDLQENVIQAESRHDGICANSSDNVMCNDNNSFYDGGDDNFHDDGDDVNDESTDMDYSNDGALGNTSVNTENQLSAGDSMGSASLKGSTKSKGKGVDLKAVRNVFKQGKKIPVQYGIKTEEIEISSRTDDNSCFICGKILSTSKSLKNHLMTHVKDVNHQFRCHICDKSYITKDRLDKHIEVHSGYEHLCHNCGKSFQTQYTLKRHMDTMHLNKGPYHCEQCDKVYSNRGHLLGHMAACHGEIKPFKCEKCQKRFSYKKNLNYHMSKICSKTESEAASHKCDKCEKSFKTKRYLKQHKQIHAEGTFVCPSCGKSFRWRSSYKEHKRSCQ